MNYFYYPGCSLTGSAREYDLATRAVLAAAGATLTEIDDWTCCGASAAAPISHLLSLSLSARNLALAEGMASDGDVLVPCSACYLNLKKAHTVLKTDADGRARINAALSAVNLTARGRGRVRHLLDVLATDLGSGGLAPLMARSLSGLSVAPYYGCQCLRPFVEFDNPERPVSMAPLIEATGADVFAWEMGARCCGAALVNTQPEAGLKRVAAILRAAKGADLIVTVCPMCQINLDAWQAKASRIAGEDLSISVLYLPQLLGLAMGLSAEALGLNLNLVILEGVREKIER
ncbi:CoB--CoM heterodisulfide reductase iron-sulfur subunit B family protein [Desulfosarcina ovata]|uniref:Heterodisulfide reductase subunit B n=1 Tax=Desulfosarcina ovata subsp. ovata TaxID=2752305 RepID=A0A5K8A9Z8_9BACT|nr:CoB--CoM heterodisulfide reductase iron-sulfur subunit B family protein [Desulfosarcina ovata]BBO89405.1 heterodisulfide reductase subunit B [Desulfosarcina ovata subsp. ovata]